MSSFLVFALFRPIVNGFYKLVYGIYFGIIKAIAWTLDLLTQLFFVFAGMTPVAGNVNDTNGTIEQVDIVNFFLTQDKFQKAYLQLCLVALGLIVVFTLGRIIKQDYFDRAGPRSKGPIFRNVALSFIAFICIIPVFYFLVSATGALALMVMKAMGYTGGGVGSMLFNMSWSDNGLSFQAVGLHVNGADLKEIVGNNNNFENIYNFVNNDNFGWYSTDTYFHFKINESTADAWDSTTFSGAYAGIEPGEFYWFIFLFGGLVVIVHLAKMMLAMVTRMYNLIALFIVAPSPISQIVLDEGTKFKSWKDKVIQESVKVIGCVMSFMLFIMIITSVNNLDLMYYVNTGDAASASNIIDVNNLTSELSNVNLLYWSGEAAPGALDNVLNALGKVMIIVAGAGAISDIDSTITPFLAGGSSSADLGAAGKSLMATGGNLASETMKAAGGAVASVAGGVVNAIGKRSLKRKKNNAEIYDALSASDDKAAKEKAETPNKSNTPGGSGGGNSGANEAAATPNNGSGAAAASENADTKSDGASTPEGGAPEGADKAAGGAENPEGVASPEDADKADDGASNPERTTPESAGEADDGAENPEGVAPEDVDKANDAASSAEEAKETPNTSNLSQKEIEKLKKGAISGFGGKGPVGKIVKGIGVGAKHLGIGVGTAISSTAKLSYKLLKSAASVTLHAVGMGGLADGFAKNVKGIKDEFKKVGDISSKYKKEAEKYNRPNPAKEAKKEAKKQKKLGKKVTLYQNMKSVAENKKTVETGFKELKDGNNRMDDGGIGMSTDDINEKSSNMISAATNLENSAEIANDYLEQTGIPGRDVELTYSGDLQQEANYANAVSDDNEAGEQLQKSQQEYNDAKTKLDGMSTDDAKYESALASYNKASAKLKSDKSAKTETEKALATATASREEVAAKNKTALYNHIKAKERFQEVSNAVVTSGDQTEENFEAREQLPSASSQLYETSKVLSKKINKVSSIAGSNLVNIQKLTKPVKQEVSKVRASQTINAGTRKDARMGVFADVSKTDASRIVSDSMDNGSSLETKARQTNAASKALGMAQDADLTYSGDLAVEDKYKEASSRLENKQSNANAAQNEYINAQSLLAAAQKEYDDQVNEFGDKKYVDPKTIDRLETADKRFKDAGINKDSAQKEVDMAQKDLDVVVKVRETQAKKNNTTMYKYAKAKEGLQAANQELQETESGSKQNVKVRVKLSKAQAAYNAASNELSQKVDSNDAENLRTSVVGPTRQRKLPNKKMAVEIIEKLDNDSTGQQQIGAKFSEVAFCALASDTRKNDTRARMNTALNDLPEDCELSFAEGELEKAIRSIDSSKASDHMDARGISSATEYASDLKARYERASDSYKTNVNRAKTAMQSFNASKDPQMLKQVKDAIAAAYADSDKIHDIKVELKNVSSD